MRFAFVEEHRNDFTANRLCQIMDVSPRGCRAWCSGPASWRQRTGMVLMAQIREQFRLSLGSYGRPRMTEGLKERCFDFGDSRVGRLMQENGIEVKRNKKFMATTDSNHAFSIAPNELSRDFSVGRPNQKWAADISYVWRQLGYRSA